VLSVLLTVNVLVAPAVEEVNVKSPVALEANAGSALEAPTSN